MATKRKADPLAIRMLLEFVSLSLVLALLFVAIGYVWSEIARKNGDSKDKPKETTAPTTTVQTEPLDMSAPAVKARFLKANNLTEADYPTYIWNSYATCSEWFGDDFESRDFLLNYPMKKDKTYEIDISNVDRSNGVPLFMQWDERWGYIEYGASNCGIGGCGPTSLSMVAYYLTGNPEYTPVYMMNMAREEGYVNSSGGTNWTLFQQGAVKLGLQVKELPAVEKRVADSVKAGKPVVVNVKESVFTKNGHYMVIVGYEDGKFRINDPNSVEFSQQLWDWSVIEDAAKVLWSISLPTN